MFLLPRQPLWPRMTMQCEQVAVYGLGMGPTVTFTLSEAALLSLGVGWLGVGGVVVGGVEGES